MFKLFFHITQRLGLAAIAMILTITEHVAAAVALPETLRALQKYMSARLDWTEAYFGIGPDIMVWAEMAYVDEKLVFMAFYFGNLFLILLLWQLTKRLIKRIFRKKPKPA